MTGENKFRCSVLKLGGFQVKQKKKTVSHQTYKIELETKVTTDKGEKKLNRDSILSMCL